MFEQFGRPLLANGYQIIPIKAGEKRPAISGWQNSKITATDLGSFDGCGVGVLCGQGDFPVVGIDIDISHPVIGPAMIDWCHLHLGWSPERTGAAPRVMLVYRAAEAGWAKGNSTSFFDPSDPLKPSGKRNEQQIEILGMGQQFVAYHIHPDTGKPYEWVDMLGGLEHVKAADLPVVTELMLDALFRELDRLVVGMEVVEKSVAVSADDDDWLLGQVLKADSVSLEDAHGYLAYLDNEVGVGYDQWVAVGMALHHQFDGSLDAMGIWSAWSALSGKHDESAIRPKWNSFGKGSKQVSIRWLIKLANVGRKDAESAARRGAMEDIVSRIGGAVDQFELIEEVALAVKQAMPTVSALRAEVFSKFQSRFKELTGGALLPMADVRKLLIDQHKVQAERVQHPMTEFGNAARMVDTHGKYLRYVHEYAQWYRWTGNYWKRAADVEVEFLAKHTINHTLADEKKFHTGDTAAEFYGFMAASQSAKMVKNMVTLAASDPQITLSALDLNKHKHLLGVLNGMVNLRTGVLMEADPMMYITTVTACNYVVGARCPIFEQVVSDSMFGNSDLMRCIWTLFGYTIQGDPKEDIMVIPYGNGCNGKSTIFETFRKMLGGYARSAAADSFVSDGKGGGGGGAREDLVRLQGARCVVVNEPDEGAELREGSVKAMTGGDAINARAMYAKTSVEIEASWVIYMATNHKPVIKGTDDGIWRRMFLLLFNRNFDTDPHIKKDKSLKEKLLSEFDGILAACVRYGIEYQKNGLFTPPQVVAARASYRSEMDFLSEWIELQCDVGPDKSSNSLELWQSFEMFAKSRGLISMVKSAQLLGRRLEVRFPAGRDKKGNRIRTGIAVKTSFLTDLTLIDLFS